MSTIRNKGQHYTTTDIPSCLGLFGALQDRFGAAFGRTFHILCVSSIFSIERSNRKIDLSSLRVSHDPAFNYGEGAHVMFWGQTLHGHLEVPMSRSGAKPDMGTLRCRIQMSQGAHAILLHFQQTGKSCLQIPQILIFLRI